MMTILMKVYRAIMVVVDFLHLCFKLIVTSCLQLWKLISPPPLKSVMGQNVLLTGAGHGIGRELALQMARLGAKIVCVDINQEWNEKTVSDIEREGGVAFGYRCDISDKEQLIQVSNKIKKEVGDINILINNAGIMPCKPLLKFTNEEIEKLFKINVFAHFVLIKEWLPVFQKNGYGHIVTMSSLAGVQGTSNLVPYCATKHAVKGMVVALQEELRYGNRNPGIKLTTVHPFVIDTGLAKKPRIRFESLTPVTSPEKCAEHIIDAIRKEEEVLFIPTYNYYFHKFVNFFPLECQKAIVDFLDTGVDEHDD